jgi:hypothetical protein
MLSHMPAGVHCQFPSARAKSSGDGDFFFYIEGVSHTLIAYGHNLTWTHSSRHTILGEC